MASACRAGGLRDTGALLPGATLAGEGTGRMSLTPGWRRAAVLLLGKGNNLHQIISHQPTTCGSAAGGSSRGGGWRGAQGWQGSWTSSAVRRGRGAWGLCATLPAHWSPLHASQEGRRGGQLRSCRGMGARGRRGRAWEGTHGCAANISPISVARKATRPYSQSLTQLPSRKLGM